MGNNKYIDSIGDYIYGRYHTTYVSWTGMRTRCNNPNVSNAYLYHDRGITVCEHWNKFTNFLEDMGERPEGMSLDRIDNDKGYYKENCRWATYSEQQRNTRRTILTLDKAIEIVIERLSGISQSNVAKKFGVASSTVSSIYNGIRWTEAYNIAVERYNKKETT